MADINYISKITLPSGTTYDIKDASAWNAIASLTGISFSVAWNGTSTPVVANIPQGVVVTYQGTTYTGTKTAASANEGTFYLVYSSTQKDGTDIYDEYIVITEGSTKKWEKIGDTGARFSDIVLKKQPVDVLTGVKVTQQPVVGTPGTSKDEVLGSGTTFTASKPNVNVTNTSTYLSVGLSGGGVTSSSTSFLTGLGTASTKNALGASATFTTNVTPTTTKISGSASGANVAWNSKNQQTVLTGVKVTTQPTITLDLSTGTSTGAVGVLTGGTVSRSNDVVIGPDTSSAVVTGYASPSTDTALGTDATFTTTVTPTTATIKATASGGGYSSPNTSTFVRSYPGATGKLVRTTITGVSGSTTASKVTTGTQTTLSGASTASSANTDWLKGVSYDSTTEALIIGAATFTTQTTTQVTGNTDVTVPKAATSSTYVATGAVTGSGDGSTVMTGLGTATTASAITGLGTFTAPSVSLAAGTGTGSYTVATGITSATTTANDKDTVTAITGLGTASTVKALTAVKVTQQPTFTLSGTTRYIKGTASGTAVGPDGSVNVIGASATFTVTQPTITISDGATSGVTVATGITSATTSVNSADTVAAVTGYSSTTSAKGLISVSYTSPTATVSSGNSGDVKVLTGATAALNAAPTITVGTNDKVNAVISVSAPSLTTNVAVGANGTANVLLSTTDVSINS